MTPATAPGQSKQASSRPRLAAQMRTSVRQKSALRQLRKQGMVPATLFAHGDPQQIQIPARALWDHLRHHSHSGVLDLELEGRVTPTLIRELERDPITGQVIHLGLQRVDLGEVVHATIPVTFVGEEHLVKEGLVLERQITEVDVTGRADQLPETLEIDVTLHNAGSIIHASDLHVPEGMQLGKTSGETVVARVTGASVPADLAAELDAQDAAHAQTAAAHAEEVEEEEEEEEEAAQVR